MRIDPSSKDKVAFRVAIVRLGMATHLSKFMNKYIAKDKFFLIASIWVGILGMGYAYFWALLLASLVFLAMAAYFNVSQDWMGNKLDPTEIVETQNIQLNERGEVRKINA